MKLSEEAAELLRHCVGVNPGLLNGVLRRLVHLPRCFASQKRNGLPELRILVRKLLKRRGCIDPLLSQLFVSVK